MLTYEGQYSTFFSGVKPTTRGCWITPRRLIVQGGRPTSGPKWARGRERIPRLHSLATCVPHRFIEPRLIQHPPTPLVWAWKSHPVREGGGTEQVRPGASASRRPALPALLDLRWVCPPTVMFSCRLGRKVAPRPSSPPDPGQWGALLALRRRPVQLILRFPNRENLCRVSPGHRLHLQARP